MKNLDLYLAMSGKWCELQDRSVCVVKGADAMRYLNGQLTNDIKSLTMGKSILAAVLNTKGKFVGELWVRLHSDGNYFFDAPCDCFEALRQRLERYIIADDVTLESENFLKGYYVFGDQPPQLSKAEIFASTRWGIKGWEIWSAHPIELFSKDKIDDELLEVCRLENRSPKWGVDFDETYLPQEAAWDENYGLHFAKGCYVGQEIVSRLQNVGRVNRQIKLIICDNATEGENLKFLIGNKLKFKDQEIAAISSIAYSPSYKAWIGLATLPRNVWSEVLNINDKSWRCINP
jgi:folate-binding protein YgfZ